LILDWQRNAKKSDKVVVGSPSSSRSLDSFSVANDGEANGGINNFDGGDNDGGGNDFYDAYNMTGLTGTMRIMAPEVIRCSPYGLPADVYSYGICMWEVFTGRKCNFLSAADICDTKTIVRPPTTDSKKGGGVGDGAMPIRLPALMQQCWHEDPKQRPDFETIGNHLKSILSELHRRSHPKEQQQQQQRRSSGSSINGIGNTNSTVRNNSKVQRQQPQQQQQQQHERFFADGAAAGRSSGQAAFWCRLEAIHASGVLDD